MHLVDFWVEDLTLGTTYCETFSQHILSKRKENTQSMTPHTSFFMFTTSFPHSIYQHLKISSLKISLTRGLKINFLLKFHVHYYDCMHGITQQTMASQLVQNTHNKNMRHLWLDMLDMSTTILINWNFKKCHIPPPPPKSPQREKPMSYNLPSPLAHLPQKKKCWPP